MRWFIRTTFHLMTAVAGSVSTTALHAAELVDGATVVEVTNTIDKGKAYAILVSGGNGPCANTWISFYEDRAASENSFKQGLAIALMAWSSGKKIRVHNYEGANCNGANFISIKSN